MTEADFQLGSAVLECNLVAVRSALLNGANPNIKAQGKRVESTESNDPQEQFHLLIWATLRHFVEGIRLLLEAGANPNAQDNQGRTALIYLVEFHSTWDLMSYSYGRIDFSGSPHDDRAELIQLLVEKGADPNLPDASGRTAIFYALEGLEVDEDYREYFDWLSVLLEVGADLNHLNIDGATATLEMREWSESTIKFLVGKGLDLNVCSKSGTLLAKIAALHPSSDQKKRVGAFFALLNAGADPNIPDDEGLYPIDYLYRWKDNWIAEALVDRDAVVTKRFQEKSQKHYTVERLLANATGLFNGWKKSRKRDSSEIDNAISLAERALIEVTSDEVDEYLLTGALYSLFELYGFRGNSQAILHLFSIYKDSEMEAKYRNVSFWATNAAKQLSHDRRHSEAVSVFVALRNHLKGGLSDFGESSLFEFCYSKFVVTKVAKGTNDFYLTGLIDFAVREYPKSPRLLSLSGQIFLGRGLLVEAELMFRNAIDLDPNGETIARWGLARAYLEQNLLDEAEKISRENVEYSPKMPINWRQLAIILLAKGDLVEADIYNKRALQMEPDNKYAKATQADIERRLYWKERNR